MVNSENVTVISKLKRFNPSGATKPPKTDELRTTLTGVTPTSPLYLKVTGTGITSVGGDCQAQASGVPGTQTGFVVKDSTGATLGVYDGGATLRSISGSIVRLVIDTTGFPTYYFVQFYYVNGNCTGPALSSVNTTLVKNSQAAGTTVYGNPGSGASTGTNSYLYRYYVVASQTDCDTNFGPGSAFIAPDGCCFTSAQTITVGPVVSEDLSGFVPPFHIE